MTKTSFVFSKGKPVVEAVVHGRVSFNMLMIVDTGADLVTAPPKVCRQLGWKELNWREIVVPGSRIEVPIYAGDIEFVGHRKRVEVMAVDLPGFTVADGLLGREFLDHFIVSFECGKQVSFKPCE